MKQRNYTFDLLCGLCILRMILLHSVSMVSLRHDFWFGKLMAWTFFFICFFFFKAGYFNKGIQGDFLPYFWDRSKRLLLPYLSWGIIGSVVYFGFLYGFQQHFHGSINRLSWVHVYSLSHFYGNPPVWFLFSFWATYIIMWFVRRRWFLWCMPLLPLVSYWLYRQGNPLWMSLNNVPMGLFMFELGHLWHRWQSKVPRNIFLVLSIIMIIVFVISNRMLHGTYDMSMNKWDHSPWGVYLNTPLALMGISGLLLSLPQYRIPVLTYIGQHSMVYFVMHYPLIYLYKFTLGVNHIRIARDWWHCGGMILFILAVCTLMVPIIERNPLLSGRFQK